MGLVLMPYTLGIIGDEQYGIWLFISSVAGYSGLMTLGLNDTICRYVARHYAENNLEQIKRLTNISWR